MHATCLSSDGLNFRHPEEWIRRIIWPLADHEVATMIAAQVCGSVRLIGKCQMFVCNEGEPDYELPKMGKHTMSYAHIAGSLPNV